jgi:hypothetical protein
VQIATSSVSIPDTGAVTRTLVLPAWAAAALQAADGLPVRLVLEASGAGLAWPVVARDATLSAQTI